MKVFKQKPPIVTAWEDRTGNIIEDLPYEEIDLPEPTEAYTYWMENFLDREDKMALLIQMKHASKVGGYDDWIDQFEFQVAKVVDKIVEAKGETVGDKGRERAIQFLVSMAVDEITRYYPYYLYYTARASTVEIDDEELDSVIQTFIEAWKEDARWFNDVHEDFLSGDNLNTKDGDHYEF